MTKEKNLRERSINTELAIQEVEKRINVLKFEERETLDKCMSLQKLKSEKAGYLETL